jgi:Peptidase S46
MNQFKKHLAATLLLLIFKTTFAVAGEGMWLLLFLQSLNEKDMKAAGMKISAEDIYSVNKGSLKDAVMIFGGGCTASVISEKGLILTNHHCGYDAIQEASTIQNNYLKNGFWAKTMAQEIPAEGLTVTFIQRIEDVTTLVLKDVNEQMTAAERRTAIEKNIAAAQEAVQHAAHEKVDIRPYYKGNQYFACVTVTYNDIRFVGAPPESMGKFGGETDNWLWPRHTADFSMFRIYAGKDNLPAAYATENQPLKPKKSVPVSIKGIKEGDFTMVLGFPGRTDEYLPASAVAQTVDITDPIRVELREKALNVINPYMVSNDTIKLEYADKYVSIANYWKKWKGEVMGLRQTNGVGKKLSYEQEFTARLDKNPSAKAVYGNILSELDALYTKITPYAKATESYNEMVLRTVDLMRIAMQVDALDKQFAKGDIKGYAGQLPNVKSTLMDVRKHARAYIDAEILAVQFPLYVRNVPQNLQSPELIAEAASAKADYKAWAKNIYAKSILFNTEKLDAMLALEPKEGSEVLRNDIGMQLFRLLSSTHTKLVTPTYGELQAKISNFQRIYMKAQLEMLPERRFYPDANGTLRLAYGKVEPFAPRDGMTYKAQTYLEGIMEKYVPNDPEFDVPQRLQDLYKTKNYGQYADKTGRLPVAFIGSNHTTGGNSGSPVFDARGNLIGLNFDRAWESTMSDISYDLKYCRNIMLDTRYLLFIIDKFADAPHLVAEMKVVK